MTVRVANDLKTEAQGELQRLVLENKQLRDKIKLLETKIQTLTSKKLRHILFSLYLGVRYILTIVSRAIRRSRCLPTDLHKNSRRASGHYFCRASTAFQLAMCSRGCDTKVSE